MTEYDWAKQFKGVSKDHPDYGPLMVQYLKWKEETARAEAYRNKLKQGIIDLWQPLRSLNRSSLWKYSNEQLIEIGRAMRKLHELMK